MTIYVEVAISLVFVFLLLSLVTSAAVEFIEVAVRKRAQLLKTAVRAMISDPTVRSRVLANPLLLAAVTRNGDEENNQESEHPDPSYIEARLFSKALLRAVIDVFENVEGDMHTKTLSLENVRKAVGKIEHSDLRSTLETLIDASEGTLEAVEDAVAQWFESSMERLTGVFKRVQQSRSFLVGLIIAASLNVDPIRLTSTMIEQDGIRTELTMQAKLYAAIPSLEDGFGASGENGSGDEDAGAVNDAAEDPIENSGTADEPICDVECLKQAANQLDAVAVGWGDEPLTEFLSAPWMLFGWLIAAVAVVPGAAFWFDILQRFINVRSTGHKPKERGA